MRKNYNVIILLSVIFYLALEVNSNGLPIVYKYLGISILGIKKPSSKKIVDVLGYNLESRNPSIELEKRYFKDGSCIYVPNNRRVIDRFSYLIIKAGEQNCDILEIIINPFAPMTPEMKVVKDNILKIFSDYPDLLEVIEQKY